MTPDVQPASITLDQVLDAFSDGLLVIDGDGLITLCNRGFRRSFDAHGRSDWVGLTVVAAVDLLAPQMSDDAGFRRRTTALIGSTTVANDELALTDGRIFERDYLPILDNGEYYGHVWQFWDVTDQRASERDHERRWRAEIIAQQVGVHALRSRAAEAEATGQDLAERNRELSQTDLLRKELLATASHELRTPLTTIMGLAEMLGDSDDAHPDAVTFGAAIARNAGRLLALVEDLLLLARVGSGARVLESRPFDLSAVVAQAVEDAEAIATTDRIAIVADIAPAITIDGDADALARTVTNVVGNAVKYSKPDGSVEVTLRRAGDEVSFVVVDNGIGIPAGELDSVFDQFFRASTARNSGRRGTGLGLAIVRSIVEQHGGTVRLTSVAGQGTTAIVTLPTSPPDVSDPGRSR